MEFTIDTMTEEKLIQIYGQQTTLMNLDALRQRAATDDTLAPATRDAYLAELDTAKQQLAAQFAFALNPRIVDENGVQVYPPTGA